MKSQLDEALRKFLQATVAVDMERKLVNIHFCSTKLFPYCLIRKCCELLGVLVKKKNETVACCHYKNDSLVVECQT